jgi:tetratricopeptide (TPR) repeat protein
MHDLLRVYAADLTHTHDTDDQRRAAITRLIDHYLNTSYTAERLMHPARDPIAITPIPPKSETLSGAPFDQDRAMTWLTTEHPVLLAIARQAAETGLDTHAWQLAWCLDTFLNRRGHWQDLTTSWQIGLDAARRLDLPVAQAYAHHRLAKTHHRLGHPQQAYTHQRRALDLYAHSGDQPGRAVAHHHLADLLGRNGSPHEAFVHAQQAFTLYQISDHHRGKALVLNQIGWLHALLGDHRKAVLSCRRALTLFQQLHDQDGEAEAWNSLGYAHHRLGRQNDAETCYNRALDLYRNIGDRYKEAAILTQLGDIHHITNNPVAHAEWRIALDILTELRHPDAITVRTKLNTAEPINLTLFHKEPR